MTDAPLEGEARELLVKPVFLFGDAVRNPESLTIGEYPWLRTLAGKRLHLPPMPRQYSVMNLKGFSIPRTMGWNLTPRQDGVVCGIFGGVTAGCRADGLGTNVMGLLPGLHARELPVGETAVRARLFRNLFFGEGGQFPCKDFRASGWVSTTSWTSSWWSNMTEAVLLEHSSALRSLDLFTPIRAVRFGLKSNPLQFFSILELYNSDSCTFFTPDGELGMAMHEMHEVSGLPKGEVPYEEFIPGSSELKRLQSEHPVIYETYWELMSHYHICFDHICGR